MELLGRIAQYLNEYANLLLAALTVVLVAVNAGLVFVTQRYVRITGLMLEEARRARERQAIPFVSVAQAGGTREDHKFVLKNEGNSVAIGVTVHLVNPALPMGKQQGRQLHLPGSVVPLIQRGALSPGASIEVGAPRSRLAGLHDAGLYSHAGRHAGGGGPGGRDSSPRPGSKRRHHSGREASGPA